MSETTLCQYSALNILVPVYDHRTSEKIDASRFSNAQYLLIDITGTVRLELTLGNGIAVDGDSLLISILEESIDSTFRGPFSHQCVVWTLEGKRLCPVFQEKVVIQPVKIVANE